MYVIGKETEAVAKFWVPRRSFYEMHMKSKFLIMKESAMRGDVKVTSLTKEAEEHEQGS